MKNKLKIILMVTGMFFLVNVFAMEPAPASKAVHQSIAKLVQDNLEYPEFAIKEKLEGTVLVKLIIQENGRFDVELANSVDDRLKKYVVYEIEHMISKKNARYAGQSVVLKLTFDLKIVR